MALNVHLRTLHGYVILSLCLLSGPSWPLGLGDIKVDSLLNAPLEARIELLAVLPEDLDHLRAAVASPRDFDWVGISRTAILDRFKFSRPISDGDNTYIRISTNSPIRQSTLNFLVEVQSHKGRLLREYTIELDTPVIAIMPPEVVTEPSRTAKLPRDPVPESQQDTRIPQTKENDPSQVPQPQTVERKTDTPESLEEKQKTAESYNSVRGDTLGLVAKKFMPKSNTTLIQMMIAIQQTNPQAFIKQNINGLKSNVTLQIPDQEAINLTSHEQAIAEVKLQNELWRNRSRQVGPSPKTKTVAPIVGDPVATDKSSTPEAQRQGEAPTKTTNSKESVDETDEQTVNTMPGFKAQSAAQTADSGQLHIITQKNETTQSGKLTVAPQEYIENLEKSARLAQELAESRRLETEEIRNRIQRLETVISQQERLINLQNNQLSGLNQRLTTATASNDTPKPLPPPQWLWFLGGMTLPLGMLLLLILYRQTQDKKERTQT